MLTKKDLEHLADLSRIKLEESEEEKLLKDLGNILNHFEELKEINTEDVKPMNGGTFSLNIWRRDEIGNSLDNKEAISEFPDSEEGYLKVPPVF